MNPVVKSDIDSFSLPADITGKLRNSIVLVTGATGLIGSAFVRCVDALQIGVKFILPVRNELKCCEMLAEQAESITIVEADLITFFSRSDFERDFPEIDYIVHCASPNNGAYVSAHPVETYLLAIESTKEILEYARRRAVKGLVYLSSIEYYGQIFSDKPITEGSTGIIDHFSERSSYSLGKQAAEYLCFSYAREYGVRAMMARPTQTFGAGVARDDHRVFAQFARSVLAGRNIVLHTTGESSKPYCYVTDVVSALCFILAKGAAGEAYNISTPGTYVSIREFAGMYRRFFNPSIEIIIDLDGNHGYAPVTKVNLDSSKLMHLGWQPHVGLPQMLERLIEYLKSES